MFLANVILGPANIYVSWYLSGLIIPIVLIEWGVLAFYERGKSKRLRAIILANLVSWLLGLLSSPIYYLLSKFWLKGLSFLQGSSGEYFFRDTFFSICFCFALSVPIEYWVVRKLRKDGNRILAAVFMGNLLSYGALMMMLFSSRLR